jgi:hypothetical protein
MPCCFWNQILSNTIRKDPWWFFSVSVSHKEVWLFLKIILWLFVLIADSQLIPPWFTSSLCSTASSPDLCSQKSEVPSQSQLLIHSKDRLNIFLIWCQLHIYFYTRLSYIFRPIPGPSSDRVFFINPGTALGLGQTSNSFPLFNPQECYEEEITYTHSNLF